jgi:hypothetical protein
MLPLHFESHLVRKHITISTLDHYIFRRIGTMVGRLQQSSRVWRIGNPVEAGRRFRVVVLFNRFILFIFFLVRTPTRQINLF